MQNFRFITHLDTFGVVANTLKLNPKAWPTMQARGEGMDVPCGRCQLPTRSLPLRCHPNPTMENWLEDLPLEDTPTLKGWKTMQLLLEQARRAIFSDPVMRPLVDPAAPLGRVMVSLLPKGKYISWHQDNGKYHERHLRFHVALTTNPFCFLHSGPEMQHLPVGALVWFNNRETHCAANWGGTNRIHAIFELPRAGVARDED